MLCSCLPPSPALVLDSPFHALSVCVTFTAIRPKGGSAFPAGSSPGSLLPLHHLFSSPRHNTYLQECTGQREPTYQLNIHDIKLLFLRFAMEQSFSADTGGGGRESNIHLIPYIIHTVLYVLNTSVPRVSGQHGLTPVFLCPTSSPAFSVAVLVSSRKTVWPQAAFTEVGMFIGASLESPRIKSTVASSSKAVSSTSTGSQGLPAWTDLQPRGEQEAGEARSSKLLLQCSCYLQECSLGWRGGMGQGRTQSLSKAHRLFPGERFTAGGCGRTKGLDLLSLSLLQ